MLLMLLIVLTADNATPSTAAAAPALSRDAQQAPSPAQRLRVFLDCDCFEEYIREQLTWVDFVRQPQDADVQVLSTQRETGGGGLEVALRFAGRGRFDSISNELRVLSESFEPEAIRRAKVLKVISIGLLGFVARDGVTEGFELTVRSAAASRQPATASDPWNLWVFSLGVGASLDAEESNREAEWDVSLTADRVTEMWKVAFAAGLDEERQAFEFDGNLPIEARRTERDAQWFVARSLGSHWSAGLDGRVASSTFGNTRFLLHTAPALEFNVFPYREYATRQFVIQYQVGVEHARYRETTLFDRLRETRGRHALSAILDQRQRWGSLQLGVEWSQYLHDRTKYRTHVDGEVALLVTRGLAVELEAFASRQHDQLSLPKRGATPEEVLLRLRELQSAYEVRLSFGVTYRFGSLFNNVVNPRFGNRGRREWNN